VDTAMGEGYTQKNNNARSISLQMIKKWGLTARNPVALK
jgi:hypothetical protein